MKFNFDYEDMKNLTFEFNDEPLRITSKIYPENLEVKIDEETNTPYLRYEGVAMSNQGPVKVTFPRLDFIINSMMLEHNIHPHYDESFIPGIGFVDSYRLITDVVNRNKKNIVAEIKLFDKEDWEQAKDFFGIEVKEK